MFSHILRPLRIACAAAALAAVLPFAASAAVSGRTMSRTEQMLAAAGFQAVPANTAERQADMAALPARRLIAQAEGDAFTYVYADPSGCDCLYLGNAADYQAYQRLALDRQIAWQNPYPSRYGSLNWDLWDPYGGYGLFGPIVPFGRGGHFGGDGGGHFSGQGGHSGGQGGTGQHGGGGRR